MIAIIDVSGANLTSLVNAVKRLGLCCQLTHDAKEIRKASHVILPGVGTAASGMDALYQYHLIDVITSLQQPLLGICLGMQLLLEYSEESDVNCLGLIPGTVRRLRQQDDYPIPHMGWNQLQWCKDTWLRQEMNDKEYVYFVHSYALGESKYALAVCEYSEVFTAVIQKNNIWGMQFHPEKSADAGMTLLKNFCSSEAV
jgi:glutamine amidotransferase